MLCQLQNSGPRQIGDPRCSCWCTGRRAEIYFVCCFFFYHFVPSFYPSLSFFSAWPLLPRMTLVYTPSNSTFNSPSFHSSYLCSQALWESLIRHLFSTPPLHSSPSDQHGSSKPPLSSSAVTSRILLRQQLMREQLQEQERREQQRQQSSHYSQTTATQTPAINVSVPVGVPEGAQVPMEVLKVRGIRSKEGGGVCQLFLISRLGSV